jgi:hypothetical protein
LKESALACDSWTYGLSLFECIIFIHGRVDIYNLA